MKSWILCVLVYVILHAMPGYGDSSYYEQQVAARFVENEVAGELRHLYAAGSPFVGLYLGSSGGESQGVVILLHQMGGHPDWPQVIGPLRTRLPELGWATLSIQMPILSPEQSIADYGRTLDKARVRIDAALEHLQQQQYQNIVVAGYSFGAALAIDYLAAHGESRIRAVIGISMQAQPFLSPKLDLSRRLSRIQLPILDIYGSRGFGEVVRGAEGRRLAGKKAGNQYYHQRVIDGADHYFTGMEGVLIRQIRGWLRRIVPESWKGTGGELRPETDTENIRRGEQQN